MSAPFLGLALLQFYNVSIMLKHIVLRLAPHFVLGGNDLKIGKKYSSKVAPHFVLGGTMAWKSEKI